MLRRKIGAGRRRSACYYFPGPDGPVQQSSSERVENVFSFVGVLAISLILFLVVAVTGRAILGR